mgnify:CR=1 FL=1
MRHSRTELTQTPRDTRRHKESPPSTTRGRLGDRLRWRDFFTLRPYGRSLLTPAVAVWLTSAWIIILLMASIEGFVWGAVGLSLVPSATPWLGPPVAVFMFVLMFSIIWIVDASLIMSERPPLRPSRTARLRPQGSGASLRWLTGILVRIAIVAISLYVTAPFIEKLIRADDIQAYHQDQVERYFQDRAATIQAQVRARAEQLDAGYAGRIASLEQEIGQLTQALQAEQGRRERIEAEYAPQIEVVSQDLAEARARVGDEVLGRDGRPEGYGPEARKWDARASLLEDKLTRIQAERDRRLQGVLARIAEQQGRLAARSDRLQRVRREQQALMERLTAEVQSQQPPPAPPRLTFAARSQALQALRQSPEEAGVPHFETVTGFAQAALGILFFALIALKLFEPPAVHAYFSEGVQLAYRRYLAGGLAGIPGLDQGADPTRRLSPLQFAHRWRRYEEDPEGYFAQVRTVSAAEARLRQVIADQDYELELLERQHENIDQRLRLEARRRELELERSANEAQRRDEQETRAHLIEELRRLIGEEREAQAQQREALSARRTERAQQAAQLAESQAELGQQNRRLAELGAAIQAQQERIADSHQSAATARALWRSKDPGRRMRREAVRQLKRLQREHDALIGERDRLSRRLASGEAERDRLEQAIAELQQELKGASTRIERHRERLDALLLTTP